MVWYYAQKRETRIGYRIHKAITSTIGKIFDFICDVLGTILTFICDLIGIKV